MMMPKFVCLTIAQNSASNPILKMVGKPFSDYHDTLLVTVNSLLYVDSLSRVKLVRFFKEAADTDSTGEWDLIHRIIECRVRFFESRDGGYILSSDYTTEDYVEDLLDIAGRAKEKGFTHINKKVLLETADVLRIFSQENERAFNYYMEAASDLETIDSKELPIRPSIFREIASLYYKFREYEEAMFYFQKIIDDPYALQDIYRSYYVAIDGFGLCYRYGFNDYERSDSCFYKILELAESRDSDILVWEGIAKGNIGYNYFLRGDLDKALSFLIPAIEKIIRFDDYPYLSYRAMNIADIYLKKNNPTAAKKYIDISLDFHTRTRIPIKDSYFYDILSKYYSSVGNAQKTILYHDSTLFARNKENEDFSGLVLRRVEQKLRIADNNLNEQKLNAEMMKSSIYRRTAILTSIASIIIFILLGFTFFFYRNMHNAYRELVRHSQNWAGLPTSDDFSTDNEIEKSISNNFSADINDDINETDSLLPEEIDIVIMDVIEKTMSDKKIFKHSYLTLDILANETGYNRYSLSIALNRCKKKNFNSYINEFRVKEAIRLISDPAFAKTKFETIALNSGFSDRSGFYRSFSKITGLSPGSFRKNISEKA